MTEIALVMFALVALVAIQGVVIFELVRRLRDEGKEVQWLRDRLGDDAGVSARKAVAQALREEAVKMARSGCEGRAEGLLDAADDIFLAP